MSGDPEKRRTTSETVLRFSISLNKTRNSQHYYREYRKRCEHPAGKAFPKRGLSGFLRSIISACPVGGQGVCVFVEITGHLFSSLSIRPALAV